MKTCIECHETKEDSEFHQKQSRCKTCNKPYAAARAKSFYEKHKEHCKARAKSRYQVHRDEILARGRQRYREEHGMPPQTLESQIDGCPLRVYKYRDFWVADVVFADILYTFKHFHSKYDATVHAFVVLTLLADNPNCYAENPRLFDKQYNFNELFEEWQGDGSVVL